MLRRAEHCGFDVQEKLQKQEEKHSAELQTAKATAAQDMESVQAQVGRLQDMLR